MNIGSLENSRGEVKKRARADEKKRDRLMKKGSEVWKNEGEEKD